MQTTPQRPSHQSWLIGVPKSLATCWWEIRHRADTIARQNVPEHNRAAGMYCPACAKGQPFSDRCAFCGCGFACFVIIETPEDALRKRHTSSRAGQATTHRSVSGQPSPRIKTFRHRIGEIAPRARWTALITAVLLLMVLTVGIKAYRSHLHRQYIYNYVQALYGIKSGMAMADRICNGSYPVWKDGKSAVGATSIKSDSRALEDVRTIKAEVDRYMGTLRSPPEEYEPAHQILQSLYALYGSRHALVVSLQDDLSRCNRDSRAVNEEFARDIANLKAQMPAPLQTEFKKAGRKYDLAFMGL